MHNNQTFSFTRGYFWGIRPIIRKSHIICAVNLVNPCFQEMNSVVFLEWFENQLMSALKNPSLVVLDNASYHNGKTEDTVCPNCSQKQAVLQNYLTRKPHIICAVILVNPCFIQVHVIIPCFPKRFDLSQIITPIIDNRHLVVQNSSIITYFL
jgi:hypothetical protein